MTYLRKFSDGTVGSYDGDKPTFPDLNYKYTTWLADFESGKLIEVKQPKNGWYIIKTMKGENKHEYYVDNKRIGYVEPNDRKDKTECDRYIYIDKHVIAFWTSELELGDARLLIEKFA